MAQRFSTIVIGVGFLTAFITAFMLLYSEGNSNYGVTDFSNSSFEAFEDASDDLLVTAQNTQTELEGLSGNPNLLQIIDSIFIGSYSAFITLGQSFNVFFTLIGAGVNLLPLGSLGVVLITVLGLSVVIIFIMFLLDYIKPGTKV